MLFPGLFPYVEHPSRSPTTEQLEGGESCHREEADTSSSRQQQSSFSTSGRRVLFTRPPTGPQINLGGPWDLPGLLVHNISTTSPCGSPTAPPAHPNYLGWSRQHTIKHPETIPFCNGASAVINGGDQLWVRRARLTNLARGG